MTLFRFELQLTYMVQKLLPSFKHPNIVYINNYIELYINTNIDLFKKKLKNNYIYLVVVHHTYI